MIFVTVGDIHIADRPPSLRTETYADDILAKVEYIVAYAKKIGADAILLLGDVFHLKSPVRTSHGLVKRLANALTAAGIPVIIVPGNHDVSNDRMESLARQPLGMLAEVEGIELLMGPHETFPIYGIPYLNDWHGLLPHYMNKYTKWADEKRVEDEGFWPLLITHAPIFPVGEDPPYEYVGSDDWVELQQNGDCAYGHIHDPHGVYRPSDSWNVTMCNYGAISRGSLHEATLKREPAFGTWDGTPGGFERHLIPVRPVEAVFRLAEKEDIDEKQERAGAFLEAVGSTSLERLSLEEVAAKAEQANLRPATKGLVLKLLEDAQ